MSMSSVNGIEDAKRQAAQRAVAEHFDLSYTFVGIGSGTTIGYVVEAIQELARSLAAKSHRSEPTAAAVPNPPPISPTGTVGIAAPNLLSNIRFVPTGYASRQVIVRAGLTPIAFDSLPAGTLIDVAFDGADEVDNELNCIKGGGACLYQEKLVATHSRKFICVAGRFMHGLAALFPSLLVCGGKAGQCSWTNG
jgi:ribose 5-phosphate isomerase A